MQTKVCHMTTVHKRHDIRIFQKECVSLAKRGFDVTLVVNDLLPDEVIKNVKIRSTGFSPKSRISKVLHAKNKIFQLAKSVDADIYHYHDPDLHQIALKFKKMGKIVIYDCHEDTINDIKYGNKWWIPRYLCPIIAFAFSIYERYVLGKISCVIAVTPHLCERHKHYCSHVFQVTNYPLIEKEQKNDILKKHIVCYTGEVCGYWNLDNVIKAMENVSNIFLYILGHSQQSAYLNSLKSLQGASKTKFCWELPYKQANEIRRESLAGLALLSHMPSSGGTLGTLGNTKLFEYMYAKTAIICTDSTLWKEIVEKWKCGICVSPFYMGFTINL